MNIANTKLKLARELLDTDDVEVINHIKAVFATQTDNWWEDLPPQVKASVRKGLKQSTSGKLIPHAEVMKHFNKWLRK